MAEFVYNPDGSHDNVPASYVANLDLVNQYAIQSQKQDASNVLRADVWQKVLENDAFHDSASWLVFDTPVDDEGSLAVVGGEISSRTLVFLWHSVAHGNGVEIKFYKEEVFRADNERTALFSEEVLLDFDNDCLQAVHGTQIKEDGTCTNMRYPFFRIIDGGKLGMDESILLRPPTSFVILANRTNDLVPIIAGTDIPLKAEDVIVPDAYPRESNNTYALGRAQSIWERVRTLQPAATSAVR